MDTTTLPALALDLRSALEDAGHIWHADQIVDLLFPAGQHVLLEALRSGTLDHLLARWIGDLAETLRCPEADAAHIRDLLTGANR